MVALPPVSPHFEARSPSPIREAQILFAQRPDHDDMTVINLAIGNVSLPMHPAMRTRLDALGHAPSPFAEGVVKYSPTVGSDECQQAFLHLIEAAGFPTGDLQCVVTDGGSQAMELMVLGVAGPRAERPVLLLDPVYTNYVDMAKRAAVPTVSVRRELRADGSFEAARVEAVEAAIQKHRPVALVIIPADNPTGQFLTLDEMRAIARVCVKHNLWLVSDEAYRQLHYGDGSATSVWALTEEDVPGITGRRVSIESASKVWNACGLRIGALVTDNPEFHSKAVAEYTANLCANVIGQHIFGALAHESIDALTQWYDRQRNHYRRMMRDTVSGLQARVPGLVVSNPEASLYSVLDLRAVVQPGFSSHTFVRWCAEKGRYPINGAPHTLLVAPLSGFYARTRQTADASTTQMRLAYVETPERMQRVPELFGGLLERYQQTLGSGC